MNLIAVYFSIISVNFYFIFHVKIEEINYKKLCGLSGIVGGVCEATLAVACEATCDFVCDFVCEAALAVAREAT